METKEKILRRILRTVNGVDKRHFAKEEVPKFIEEEEGLGTVEIILIIFVLIGLVIIFKDRITELVNNIFESITSESDDVIGDY